MTDEPDLYLSYSGRKCYLTCPKKYQYNYVKHTPVDSDPRSSFFGSMIGKVFEWFYEKKLWAAPDQVATTLDHIEPAITEVLKEEDWDEFSDPNLIHEIRQELRDLIPKVIDVIRERGLVTLYSCAERKLDITKSKNGLSVILGGRADFIHGSDLRDIWIIDGKGSKYREKYVDSDQLVWYATLYYLRYRIAPTRIGFLFYRFPEDPIVWVNLDENAMRSLINKTFEIAEKIKAGVFPATPSGECKLCDYKDICEEGSEHLISIRPKKEFILDDSIEYV